MGRAFCVVDDGGVDTDQTRRALDALREVLRQIERGELEATRAQRAYLRGAVDALGHLRERREDARPR